jgi:hypothetical protein
MMNKIRRKGFDLLHQFGLYYYAVKIYERYSDDFRWTPDMNVDEEIGQYRSASQNKGYILFPLFIVTERMCLRTFLLAHAFRDHEYTPIVIYNYRTLPVSYDSKNNTRRKNEYLITWFSERFSINCLSVDEITDENWSTTEIEDHVNRTAGHGIDITDISISDAALASTRKSLRRYSLNLNNSTHWQEYITQATRGVIIAEAMDTITSWYEFDAVLSWDISYVHGRIPLRICESKDISQYTQQTGYHRGSLIYGNGGNRMVSGRFMSEDLVRGVLSNPLSRKEKSQIQELMNKRASGNKKYNRNTADANSTIQSQDDYTVGIFTHLLWDGALEPDQAIYPDFFDWLDDTINIGKKSQELQFILKIHPAEEIRETNQKVIDWMDANHPNLPSNFTILSADTDVDTYNLFDAMDAGIVYASTVGLEMAYNNIPVVTGGYPPYHGFDITFDPETTANYKELIGNIETLTHSRDMMKRARRFAYLLFISKHFEFPYMDQYLSDNEDRIYIESEEIIEKLNPVVNSITEGMEVIDPEYNIR